MQASFSLCSFSMMVKCAYDGLLQANVSKTLFNDGQFLLMMVKCLLMMVKCLLMMVKCLLMMVKCSSMIVKWVYDHTLISQSLTSIWLALAWSEPSYAHLTIIEKLHWLSLKQPWCMATLPSYPLSSAPQQTPYWRNKKHLKDTSA